MRKLKKILVFSIINIFFLSGVLSINSISTSPYLEEQITVDYYLKYPSLKQIEIEGITYDYLIFEDAPNFGNPGDPSLPIKSSYILLPYNTDVESINIETGKKTSLGTGYNVLPVSEPIPISLIKSVKTPSPNIGIYESNDLFPGKLYDKVGIHSFRGFQILVLSLYPVQYNPVSGDLFYYSNMKITVETRENHPNIYYHGLERDKLELMKKVDNPEIIKTYPQPTDLLDQYDMMILTTNDLKNAFQPLKQYHDNRGVVTQIKTLRDININPNSVTAEDIRDYIRAEYQNKGIQYVLIGGDDNFVPAKMLYVSGYDEDMQSRFYETIMPSDLYYACLDGTYNSDGDSYWGESDDGEGGEDVDLIAEVFIGRACVGNTEEVNNFVEKTIAYLNTDYNDEYLKKVLMAGEHLGDYGIASWGGNYLDLLIDECTVDGYTTQGMPSDFFIIEKMYDRDWEDNYWSPYDLIDTINNNVHIINHDGHSNYVYNMKMSIWDMDLFTNEKPFFTYSLGCMCGGFDKPEDDDCFAEYITTKIPHGAFAAIMNARYGWFWAYSTDGDGTRFKREFWDAVFAEDIPVISKANQDSKEDNLYILGRSCIRWTYYQLNYFGDPSIAFKISQPPEKPEKPEGETSITTGEIYTYTTNTIEPDGEQIWYKWDWGDGTFSEWIGPYSSGETCEASNSWSEKGNHEIHVKAIDSVGIESPWSDPLSISIAKNKHLSYNFLQEFIQKFSFFFLYWK